ncbi:MAG: helix-turn-helix domain-containing protein [Brachybacterium sp.]|uniref:helix-turn-helix domain-containing protein n=1 Tax=Micrococcales TaxID=85006 RepID=UPI003F9E8542
MTSTEPRRSLIEQLRTERPLDAAAARAAVRAVGLMNEAHAMSERSTRRELAETVGVSEGRISQLLNGDGNVRVSTLARMLKASGFDLELALAGVPDAPRKKPRRSRGRNSADDGPTYLTVRTETAVGEGPEGPGIQRHRTVEFSSRDPQHETIESVVEWTGIVAPAGAEGTMAIRYVGDDSAPVDSSARTRGDARV